MKHLIGLSLVVVLTTVWLLGFENVKQWGRQHGASLAMTDEQQSVARLATSNALGNALVVLAAGETSSSFPNYYGTHLAWAVVEGNPSMIVVETSQNGSDWRVSDTCSGGVVNYIRFTAVEPLTVSLDRGRGPYRGVCS